MLFIFEKIWNLFGVYRNWLRQKFYRPMTILIFAAIFSLHNPDVDFDHAFLLAIHIFLLTALGIAAFIASIDLLERLKKKEEYRRRLAGFRRGKFFDPDNKY